eukprot:7814439-Karenia_brevis.AAC.1
MNTVKTHKPQGSINLRAIHGSASYPFKGIASWCRLVLDDRISQFKFVCRSTDQVLQRLPKKLPQGACFVHWDLDDFFNKGTHAHLRQSATNLVYKKWRTALNSSLEFLLTHQYVMSNTTGEVHEVILGSGQGLPHSGAVANASFLWSCELNGPRLASRM